MRRWIALGVAAVGVVWTPYLYSEWQASRGAARHSAEASEDELQQPSAAAAESQLSAAEDHPTTPKPPPPLPQPVPVAPDPSLQRRGEAVATAAPNAARPSLTARLPDSVAAPRAEQSERSPDAPLTTHAIEAPKPPPQAPPEAPTPSEPAAKEAINAAPSDEPNAQEHASDQPAHEPSAQAPTNAPESEAPAQPSNESAANEATE